jgi:integrase
MKRKPPGLHHAKGANGKVYYSCIHPITGKRHGLGSDFVTACKVLHRLQSAHPKDRENAIFERIEGKGKTFGAFVEKFKDALQERNLKPNTLKMRHHILDKVLMPRFGGWQLKDVDAEAITNLLNEFKSQGKNRMAQTIRSALVDLFLEAISSGWLKANHNPASLTRNPTATAKRSRLSLEQFKVIYSLADDEWMQLALELAILTSHAGATELTAMQKPVDGYLQVQRTKTDVRVKIPMTLKLDALGWTLEDTIAKCLTTGIESPYLLHHISDAGNMGKGKKMHPYRITRAFTEIVRRSGIVWEDGKQPATLYEVRSLSERLYRKQGVDVKTLLGHKDSRSTERYDDVRGDDWLILDI